MTKLGASLKELVEKFVTPNRTPGSGSCDQSQAKKTLTFVHPYALFAQTTLLGNSFDQAETWHGFACVPSKIIANVCFANVLDLLF